MIAVKTMGANITSPQCRKRCSLHRTWNALWGKQGVMKPRTIALAALLLAAGPAFGQDGYVKTVKTVICTAAKFANVPRCDYTATHAVIKPDRVLPSWDRQTLPESTIPTPTKTVLTREFGGSLNEHWERFRVLAAAGGEVEIRGVCPSACTLIMSHVAKDKLCFSDRTQLLFHQAQFPNGEPAYDSTRKVFDTYPAEIRAWIIGRGGIEKMPHPDFWVLWASDLWKMDYRKCSD
jgi:hypothetical protein